MRSRGIWVPLGCRSAPNRDRKAAPAATPRGAGATLTVTRWDQYVTTLQSLCHRLGAGAPARPQEGPIMRTAGSSRARACEAVAVGPVVDEQEPEPLRVPAFTAFRPVTGPPPARAGSSAGAQGGGLGDGREGPRQP